MIESTQFPRVSPEDELVLRLVEGFCRPAIEIVEMSDGRVASGTIYSKLSRLVRRGLLQKITPGYLVTVLGSRVLRAYEAAQAAFDSGETA